MASNQTFSEKSPPPFNGSTDDYTKWKTKFQLWREIADVAKTKQAVLMALKLDDVTQEAILDLMTHLQLKEEAGADTLLGHLDKMFKKDESITSYELYEKFESYQRPAELSIKEYCAEFHKRLSKVKSSGTQLSEHVLAYRLLKSANLSDAETQLVKATISKMDYDTMVTQLQKVFNSGASQMSAMKIKEEPSDSTPSETYYGGNRKDQRYGRNDSYRYQRNSEQNPPGRNNDDSRYSSQRYPEQQTPKKRRGKNPLDSNGNVSRCRICDSINHWRIACPDRED